jgi:hypothetical protein
MAGTNKRVTPVRIGTVKDPVTLSFPHLVEPQEFPVKPGEAPRKPQYSCVVVLTAEQVAAGMLEPLRKIAGEARDNFFGQTKPRGLRSPFRKNEEMWEEGPDGKLIPAVGYPAGGVFVSLKAGAEKPDCRDEAMRPVVDTKVLYPGCKVNAICSAYGYDYQGNKGVSIGLSALQKVGDGENIAGRVSAADYFQEVKTLTDNSTTGATTGDGWDEDDEVTDENF